MTERGPPEEASRVDEATRRAEELAAGSDVYTAAWEETLDDVAALAAERREDGFEVLTLTAGTVRIEARATGPEADEDARYGLVFVVPGDEAETFDDAFEAGGYPVYEVYRADRDGRTFLVVEYLDPDSERAIMIAANYRTRDAEGLVNTVEATGEMYTHVETLDGTHHGSFRHDDPANFFPDADV